MSLEQSAAAPEQPGAEPEQPERLAEPTPHSRRNLLVGGLAGLAGAMLGALGRPAAAIAAAGDPLVLGQDNYAGGSATRLHATSSGGAFWMTQNGSGSGVRGDSTNGSGGVFSTGHPDRHGLDVSNTAGAGTGAAILATGGANDGIAVSTAKSGGYAIEAISSSTAKNYGSAVYAHAEGAQGIEARSTSNVAIFAASTNDAGVYGSSYSAYGVHGAGAPAGVYGSSTSTYGSGVEGLGYGSSGHGLVGSINQDSGNAAGVYGQSAGANSFAGYFAGDVGVTGTVSKAGGSFLIDHPLDPANKILQHSFVESPDMLNIYNGVISADANGEATVELPAYFMALNRDFRYSLTPIGTAMSELHVKSKAADGRFTIAGAAPGQEVSWQLTGIRQDAWANVNRIEVELAKQGDQKGKYLHPVEHGQPASKGVDWEMHQRIAKNAERTKRPTPR